MSTVSKSIRLTLICWAGRSNWPSPPVVSHILPHSESLPPQQSTKPPAPALSPLSCPCRDLLSLSPVLSRCCSPSHKLHSSLSCPLGNVLSSSPNLFRRSTAHTFSSLFLPPTLSQPNLFHGLSSPPAPLPTLAPAGTSYLSPPHLS